MFLELSCLQAPRKIIHSRRQRRPYPAHSSGRSTATIPAQRISLLLLSLLLLSLLLVELHSLSFTNSYCDPPLEAPLAIDTAR